jgi:hypothetical protein
MWVSWRSQRCLVSKTVEEKGHVGRGYRVSEQGRGEGKEGGGGRMGRGAWAQEG